MASGTSRLTDEQSDEMFDHFGIRYRHVQSGDPYLANRRDRRRGFVLSPAGYEVQLMRKLDERRTAKERALANLTAVKETIVGRLRRKAA